MFYEPFFEIVFTWDIAFFKFSQKYLFKPFFIFHIFALMNFKFSIKQFDPILISHSSIVMQTINSPIVEAVNKLATIIVISINSGIPKSNYWLLIFCDKSSVNISEFNVITFLIFFAIFRVIDIAVPWPSF